jgi:hypothetical protein
VLFVLFLGHEEDDDHHHFAKEVTAKSQCSAIVACVRVFLDLWMNNECLLFFVPALFCSNRT